MKSRGHKLHEDLIEVYGAMILRVKARMDAGEDVPDCLVKTLLETQEDEKLDWEDLCMLCAVFIFVVHSVSVGRFQTTQPNAEIEDVRHRVPSNGSSP